jgi:hypothetical protein
LALRCRLTGSTLLLTDLCTGQKLTQLLHTAEETQRHPSPLPGAEERRGRGMWPETEALKRHLVQGWPPTKPTLEGDRPVSTPKGWVINITKGFL